MLDLLLFAAILPVRDTPDLDVARLLLYLDEVPATLEVFKFERLRALDLEFVLVRGLL